MKVNMGDPPKVCNAGVQVGNVYPAKGGRGDTRFWLVLSLTNSEQSAHMLGLNFGGEVVSTQSYSTHALREREVVGFCAEVSSFYPVIQWRDPV